MKELHDRLKSLIQEHSGSISMAEIARKANIDRSTLYKILRGERKPTASQLSALLDVLNVSPEQYHSMLFLFDASHSSQSEKDCNSQIYSLLRSICMVQSSILAPYSTPPLFHDSEQIVPPFTIQGLTALKNWLRRILYRYATSNSALPLYLSPTTSKLVTDCLVEVFSLPEATNHTVKQLCLFAKNTNAELDFMQNLRTLSNSVPFLFLEKMQYQARLCHSSTSIPTPGILMPIYLLFPAAALFIDISEQKAIYIQDSNAVEFLRQQFSQQYLNTQKALFLDAQPCSCEQAMRQTNSLARTGGPACWLRYDPPLLRCIDSNLAMRLILPESISAQAGIQSLLDRLEDIINLAPSCYFSEDGLLDFVSHGKLGDVPDDLYHPLSPSIRRLLLERLKELCITSPTPVRLVDSKLLPLAPNVIIDVYESTGIQMFQKLVHKNESSFRSCHIHEDSITSALINYLVHFETNGFVRSKQYTVDFIDYCIRKLV